MSDGTEKLLAGILSSLKAGRVRVRVNDHTEYTVEAKDKRISVRMSSNHLFSRHNLTMGSALTDLRMLKRLAAILSESSIRVEVFLDNRKVFSMGEGISSFLGNEKVNFLNLLRASKR